MANKMKTMQKCCCEEEPNPPLVCFRCLSGTTPRFFDVTVPRSWAKRSTTGAVLFEIPAGTYRCEQVDSNTCLWKVAVGSYQAFTPSSPFILCPGPNPETANMFIAARLEPNGIGGIQVQFGTYREQPALGNNFGGPGMFNRINSLGSGSIDCKTIDVSGTDIGQDTPSTGECVFGPFAYFGHDAGDFRCKAIA